MASGQASYESLVDVAVNSAVGLVQHFSADELKAILNDDEKLDNLLRDLPQVKSMKTEREMLLAQNKSLAEWNLAQEPKLKQAKETVMEAYEQAAQLKEEAERKKKQLDDMADKRSLDTTLALLQAAAQEAEDESETIAESFLDGGMTTDEFWTEFEPKRSLAHRRRLKAEKLNEILRSQQFGASGGHTRTPYPVPDRRAPPVPARQQYPAWNSFGTV